jgi:hypothetical protein
MFTVGVLRGFVCWRNIGQAYRSCSLHCLPTQYTGDMSQKCSVCHRITTPMKGVVMWEGGGGDGKEDRRS